MLLSCRDKIPNEQGTNKYNTPEDEQIYKTLYSVKVSDLIKSCDTLVWSVLSNFNTLSDYHSEVINIYIDSSITDSIGASRIVTLKQGEYLTETVIAWSNVDSMSFKVIPTPIDTNPELVNWNFGNLINTFVIQAHGDSTFITITTSWDYLKEASMHPEHIEVDKRQFIIYNNNMIAGLKKILEKKVVKRRFVPRTPVVIDSVVITDTTASRN